MKYLVQILLFLTLAAVATARADDIVETPNTEALGFALCSAEDGQDLTVELDPEAVYTFQPYTRDDAKLAAFARNDGASVDRPDGKSHVILIVL
ncbi:MAG: hypothetical protein AAGA23_15880 [Pseudomonadota bacterium]